MFLKHINKDATDSNKQAVHIYSLSSVLGDMCGRMIIAKETHSSANVKRMFIFVRSEYGRAQDSR